MFFFWAAILVKIYADSQIFHLKVYGLLELRPMDFSMKISLFWRKYRIFKPRPQARESGTIGDASQVKKKSDFHSTFFFAFMIHLTAACNGSSTADNRQPKNALHSFALHFVICICDVNTNYIFVSFRFVSSNKYVSSCAPQYAVNALQAKVHRHRHWCASAIASHENTFQSICRVKRSVASILQNRDGHTHTHICARMWHAIIIFHNIRCLESMWANR